MKQRILSGTLSIHTQLVALLKLRYQLKSFIILKSTLETNKLVFSFFVAWPNSNKSSANIRRDIVDQNLTKVSHKDIGLNW